MDSFYSGRKKDDFICFGRISAPAEDASGKGWRDNRIVRISRRGFHVPASKSQAQLHGKKWTGPVRAGQLSMDLFERRVRALAGHVVEMIGGGINPGTLGAIWPDDAHLGLGLATKAKMPESIHARSMPATRGDFTTHDPIANLDLDPRSDRGAVRAIKRQPDPKIVTGI